MLKIRRYGRGDNPFVAVAKEKGFYVDEGIDLELVPGIPSYVGAKIVGTEAHALDSFAQSDGGVLIQAKAEDIPIACVGAFVHNAVGIGGLKDKGITKPKDIEGRKVCFANGSGEALEFPVFAALNNVDLGKVKFAYTGAGTGKMELGPRAVLEGRADMFGGYWADMAWQLVKYEARKRGGDVVFLKYSDYGLQGYQMCQVCNVRMIKEKPNVVRGFLRATLKGLAWLIDNPEEAVELTMKYRGYPQEAVRATVYDYAEAARGPGVTRNGLGWMSLDLWNDLQNKMYQTGRIIETTDIGSWLSNDFLPKGLLPNAWK